MQKVKYVPLLLAPATAIAQYAHLPATVVFVLAALALIPLAGLLGEATEELAAHLGEQWGGFLNATFGNLAELIIAITALRAGAIELVKLSLVGSIIGNLFLVLGASMVVGGIRHGRLTFSAGAVGQMVTLLVLSLATMLIPTVAHHIGGLDAALEHKTIGTAVALLALYALLLAFRFRNQEDHVPPVHVAHDVTGHRWGTRTALAVLCVSALAIGAVSEMLIHHVEAAGHTFGWSAAFLGLFIVPLVGNVAEHFVAIIAAAKNRMDLSIEIAVGSAAQIALFAVPVLVLLAPLFGQELTLVFSPLALGAICTAVIAAWLVLQDGTSNWFEGSALLVLAGLFGYYTF